MPPEDYDGLGYSGGNPPARTTTPDSKRPTQPAGEEHGPHFRCRQAAKPDSGSGKPFNRDTNHTSHQNDPQHPA